MKANTIVLSALFLSLIIGCTSIRGKGESYNLASSDICVITNKKVTVPFFEEDLVNQLEDRSLRVVVVSGRSECPNPYSLTYTAFRSVGIVTKIKLSLYENGLRVAYLDWDNGRGGFESEVMKEQYDRVEYWQTAEALAGLFGEMEIE